MSAEAALNAFLAEAAGLSGKLGPLLFQFPPSLIFDEQTARSFFSTLRARFDENVVCEPRHQSWFTAPADILLREFQISRVAADPPAAGIPAEAGGWDGLLYLRLHGSPRIYYSAYGPQQLERFAQQLIHAVKAHRPAWCIFDNTAAGAATANALALQEHVRRLLA